MVTQYTQKFDDPESSNDESSDTDQGLGFFFFKIYHLLILVETNDKNLLVTAEEVTTIVPDIPSTCTSSGKSAKVLV